MLNLALPLREYPCRWGLLPQLRHTSLKRSGQLIGAVAELDICQQAHKTHQPPEMVTHSFQCQYRLAQCNHWGRWLPTLQLFNRLHISQLTGKRGEWIKGTGERKGLLPLCL